MTKVLQATSRGQVTLPKVWRDQFNTKYFIAEVSGDSLLIRPLSKSNLEDTVESAWNEYKQGDFLSSEELMEKYGL